MIDPLNEHNLIDSTKKCIDGFPSLQSATNRHYSLDNRFTLSQRQHHFYDNFGDSKLDPRVLIGGPNPSDDEDNSNNNTNDHLHNDEVYHELRDDTENQKRANITHTYLNILKSFVGSGFLFIPSAFMQGGILFSNFVFLSSLFINIVMINRLVKFCRPDLESLSVMAEVCYGRLGRILIDSSVYFSQMSFVTVYMTFVARTCRDVYMNVFPASVPPSLSILMVVQVPIYALLAMVRRIRYFGPSTILADILIGISCTTIFIFILYESLFPPEDPLIMTDEAGARFERSPIFWTINPVSWPLFLGFAAYTWEGIVMVLPVRAAMEELKKPFFSSILSKMMTIICIFFCLYGTLGYIAFGNENMQTIVLANMPNTWLGYTVQLSYCAALIFSVPLVMYPAQQVMDKLLYPGPPIASQAQTRKWVKNISRWVQILGVFLLAVNAEQHLDLFLALIGSVCCIPVAYIYPPLLHMKMNPNRFQWRNLSTDLFVLILGLYMMFLTTYQAISTWNRS